MPKQGWGYVVVGMAGMILGAAIAAGLVIHWSRPTRAVLWQACQPADVTYDGFDPYCLSVVEGDLNWTFMPLSTIRHTFVFVGRGTGINYGHYLDYGPQFRGQDPVAYMDQATLDWTAEGITLTEPTGHRLFLPAESFVGGR